MTPGTRIRVLPTAKILAQEAADFIRDRAAEAVDARGRISLALSGGRTPRLLYTLLAAAGPGAFPYDRLEVFWSDERAVPADHPGSNYRLARDTWLARVPLPPAQIHRIRGEEEPTAEADRYERAIRERLGEPPRFDVILLGIGSDGHTASIFPGAPPPPAGRLVVAATAPAAPRRRITFTFDLIALGRRVVVLAAGAAKAAAVHRALVDAPSPAVPASRLRGPHVTWFLDEAAAGALPAPAD